MNKDVEKILSDARNAFPTSDDGQRDWLLATILARLNEIGYMLQGLTKS